MLGSGGVSDGYEGTKRPRMMDSNPYFAVSSGLGGENFEVGSKRSRMTDPGPYFSMGGVGSSYQPYGSSFGGEFGDMRSFPVVRLRGLPFDCEDLDIVKFFMGLDILDCLLVNKNGRFTGEAFVVFPSHVQAELALQRDRHNMGHRYIEVFRCTKQEYYHAVAAEVNNYVDRHHRRGSVDDYRQSAPPPTRAKNKPNDSKEKLEFTEVLKLRGLPYSVTKADILEFFREFELSEDRVHIGFRSDGKATGEAFVEFPSVDAAKTAMSKDKLTIGSRYVELFPATPAEAKKAEARAKELNK